MARAGVAALYRIPRHSGHAGLLLNAKLQKHVLLGPWSSRPMGIYTQAANGAVLKEFYLKLLVNLKVDESSCLNTERTLLVGLLSSFLCSKGNALFM